MSRTTTTSGLAATAGRLTALLAGALLCARALVDPDLWGHLTFGADILSAGRITTVDPYSFTQDVPWVNHEWLSEVGFALAYRLGGVAGLVLLKTLLLGATLWLLWRELEPLAGQAKRWWLLAVVAFALAPAGTSFRPQLWTLLALAVLVRALAGRLALAWVVPVFAVWGNLHGGWIVGVGLVSSTLAGRVLDRGSLRQVAGPALVLLAAVAATIVNPSGAGKSTFADLLMGLLSPSSGELLVDDVPLSPERLQAWRNQIGYVAQETFLFHDTVRANLVWASPGADDGAVWRALEQAAAADFVRALPAGLDTIVGDRGVLLSGGERQRLSLARALLRQPQLLILDEATSSLDSENERRIQAAIDHLHEQTTIVVITHRLSTIRNADMIYVVERGRVVESGSWASLLAGSVGRFRALCDAQGIEVG